jgi:hypothetical protein
MAFFRLAYILAGGRNFRTTYLFAGEPLKKILSLNLPLKVLFANNTG